MEHFRRARGRPAAVLFVLLVLVAACDPHPVIPDPLYEGSAVPSRVIAHQPRVLLLGDSNMDILGSAARVALLEAGAQVSLVGLWGVGLFTRAQYDYGTTNPSPPSGEVLAVASRVVAEFDPDVVAVYLNHNYWPSKNPTEDPSLPAGYPRDAFGVEIQPRTPGFRTMAQAQLRALVDRLRVAGADVLLVEPPGVTATQTSDDNFIWTSYVSVQEELGFGVIHAADAVNNADGTRAEGKSDCRFTSHEVFAAPGDLHLSYFGGGLVGSLTARAAGEAAGLDMKGVTGPTDAPAALVRDGTGYRVVTCDGAAFRFGTTSTSFGGVALGGGRSPGDAVVGAARAAGGGWWQVTDGGRVFALGGAPDLGGAPPGSRVAGMAGTPTGLGYWLLQLDGSVTAFGDALPLGGVALPSGVLARSLTATADGTGYWILTSTGQVIARGTALFHGDLSGAALAHPPVALAPAAAGLGYWILDEHGTVHPFGLASALGSAADIDFERVVDTSNIWAWKTEVVDASVHPTTAVDIEPSATGGGYWVALANGGVCHFGDAPDLGGVTQGEVNSYQVFLGRVVRYPASSPCG